MADVNSTPSIQPVPAENKNVMWTIVGIALTLAFLFLIFWAMSRGWKIGQTV